MIQLDASGKAALGEQAKLGDDELVELEQPVVLAHDGGVRKFYVRASRVRDLLRRELHGDGTTTTGRWNRSRAGRCLELEHTMDRGEKKGTRREPSSTVPGALRTPPPSLVPARPSLDSEPLSATVADALR